MNADFDFQQITSRRSGGNGSQGPSAFYEVTDPIDYVDRSDEALTRAAEGYTIMMLDDPRPLPHTAEELESATRAVLRCLHAQNQSDRLATDLKAARCEPWRPAADSPAEEDGSGYKGFPTSNGGSWPRNLDVS